MQYQAHRPAGPAILRLMAALSLFLCLPSTGCVGTAAPDPPDGAPHVEPPMPPDPEKLGASNSAGGAGVEITAMITGAEGAVEPGVTVFAIGLFSTAPPATVEANEDGSFSLDVIIRSDRPVARFETRAEGRHSDPLDLHVRTAEMELDPVRLDPCVRLTTQLPLGNPTRPFTREISVTNVCGADLTVARIRERIPRASLTIDDTGPRTIPDGMTTGFNVTYTPGEAVDDVLLVDFEGAATETHAVSVYAGE